VQLGVVVGAQRFIAEGFVCLRELRRLDRRDLLELAPEVLNLVGMLFGYLAAARALDLVG